MLRTADDYERLAKRAEEREKKRSLAMTYGGIRFEIRSSLGLNAWTLLIAFPTGQSPSSLRPMLAGGGSTVGSQGLTAC